MILVPLLLLLLVVISTFFTFLNRDSSKNGFTDNSDFLGSLGQGLISSDMDTGKDIASESYKTLKEQSEKKSAREKGTKPSAKESFFKYAANLVVIMTPKVKIMLTVYQIVSNLPFALDIQYTAVTAKLFYAFS
jgi:hypothetical protein